ncbi:MAG: cytochrome c oxidase assembly protein [Betaproteobacteria bacterium]|nr:cytochrome c oxidase assembly protein [Betaproteobacteria bacterium]
MVRLLIFYLTPWEFSPTVAVCCLTAALLYARGMRQTAHAGEAVGLGRVLSFFSGLALIYLSLQSYFDFLSQHMFWVHRLQQLFLHHVGPFLIILSAPGPVMAQGIPARWRARWIEPVGRWRPLRAAYRFVQQPFVAAVLFVGLLYFWLIPAIHFTAMLDVDRYRAMNWGMVIDGLLFWQAMLTVQGVGRQRESAYLLRFLMLFLVMIGQLLLGAYIFFHGTLLYTVYALCGRAWPINPMTDQQLGGLLTWIPPDMMSVIGSLVILRKLTRNQAVTSGVARDLRAEGPWALGEIDG